MSESAWAFLCLCLYDNFRLCYAYKIIQMTWRHTKWCFALESFSTTEIVNILCKNMLHELITNIIFYSISRTRQSRCSPVICITQSAWWVVNQSPTPSTLVSVWMVLKQLKSWSNRSFKTIGHDSECITF